MTPRSSSKDEGENRPLTLAEVEVLLRETQDDLVVWFHRKVDDPETAADLFGETWDRAYRSLPDFRPATPDDPRRWLWRIAVHVLADHNLRAQRERRLWRRLGRRRLVATDQDIEKINDRAARDQLHESIAAHLAELPEAQREAVRLHVIEELPYEQIAERTETTAENARARVSRALRKLGAELEPEYRQWREDNL